MLTYTFSLANAFSYWQGQEINNGTHSFVDDIMQALQHVQTIKKKTNVNFWVGETNWPTGGKDYEKGIPNVTNAARYWKEAICGILAWGVDTFVFEAFDEVSRNDMTSKENADNEIALEAC
jgi:glucan 1,3-beta-glucosidase